MTPLGGGPTWTAGDRAWRGLWRLEGVDLLAGVVGAADEGARLDVGEAERLRRAAQAGELVGRDVALDRQVAGRGLQVLAERQDVAADGAQVGEDLQQLGARLAQAEHQTRLGGAVGREHFRTL